MPTTTGSVYAGVLIVAPSRMKAPAKAQPLMVPFATSTTRCKVPVTLPAAEGGSQGYRPLSDHQAGVTVKEPGSRLGGRPGPQLGRSGQPASLCMASRARSTKAATGPRAILPGGVSGTFG